MNDKQWYEILGVNSNASEREVKEKYQFLAQSNHPDKFASEAHKKLANEKLKEINIAYDEFKRNREFGRSPFSNQRPDAGPQHPTNAYTVPTKNGSNQRRSSRWGVIALGVLVVFVIMCGTSIYIGKSLLTSNPANNNASSEMKTDIPRIRFTSEVYTQIQQSSVIFRVQPVEMSKFYNNSITLKISICNSGNQTGMLSPLKLWYTPPDGGNTINWNTDVRLKPGECKVSDLSNTENSYEMVGRPFGKLNYTVGEASILGSIDLNKADSQGYIQIVGESTNNNPIKTDPRRKPITITDGKD
jgi:DnaJ domain